MSQSVNDLSRIHTLVSDFFKWPSTSTEWSKYKLSSDQIAFFHEHGYLSNIKLLEEWQVNKLNAELAEIADPSHPSHSLFYEFHSNESANPDAVLFHALGAWRITPGFHDVIWNPAFVAAASQLLDNSAIRFWHDQLFCKPAHHGGVVAWHQDYSYWTRTGPMQHLTCWVALDDATTENGCLMYVPGSHKWNLVDMAELAGDMDGVMNFLTEEQKKAFKPVPIDMKAGYGSFHHPLLMHGSYENRSARSRRAFVLNVFKDGTLSNTNGELLEGVPIIPDKQKMEGQFYPLIYDPKLMN